MRLFNRKNISRLRAGAVALLLAAALPMSCSAASSAVLSPKQGDVDFSEGTVSVSFGLSTGVSADTCEYTLSYDEDMLRLRSVTSPTTAMTSYSCGSENVHERFLISNASADVKISSLGTAVFDVLKKGESTVTVENGIVNALATDVITTLPSASVKVTVVQETPGDINGDGTTDLLDVVSMMVYFSGDSASDPGRLVLDVNNDGGTPNVSDLIRLMQYVANSETEIY